MSSKSSSKTEFKPSLCYPTHSKNLFKKKKKTIVFSSNLFPKGGTPCPLCLPWHNSAEPFFSDFFLVSQKPTKRKKKTNPPSYHSFLVSQKMFICNLKVLFATPASVLTTNKLCMVSPEQIPSGQRFHNPESSLSPVRLEIPPCEPPFGSII